MNTPTKIIKFLQNYNAWRRGDETLEMPHPAEIGANIQDAIVLLRKNAELEAELISERSRLDWLDQQGAHYGWKVQLPTDYPNVKECVFVCRNTTSGHKTIREAIDTAMKKGATKNMKNKPLSKKQRKDLIDVPKTSVSKARVISITTSSNQ